MLFRFISTFFASHFAECPELCVFNYCRFNRQSRQSHPSYDRASIRQRSIQSTPGQTERNLTASNCRHNKIPLFPHNTSLLELPTCPQIHSSTHSPPSPLPTHPPPSPHHTQVCAPSHAPSPSTSYAGTLPPSNGATTPTVSWSLGYVVMCPAPAVSVAKTRPPAPPTSQRS